MTLSLKYQTVQPVFLSSLMAVVAIGILLSFSIAAPSVTVANLIATQKAPRPIVYRQIGGRTLYMYHFAPTNIKADEIRPALIVIHGGGWSSGDPTLMAPVCRYFASRGMQVFNLQYRLTQDGGPYMIDCVSDAQAAVRFLRANARVLKINPNRIAATGDSSGGHLAGCLGTMPTLEKNPENGRFSSMVNATFLFNPIVDISALPWASSREGTFLQTSTAPANLQTPKAQMDYLSPITYVKAGLPPCLIIHGTSDTVVPIIQCERFVAAMKQVNNRCDLIALTGVQHAFILPGYGSEATIVRGLQESDRFLASLGFLRGLPTIVIAP